MHAIYYIYHVYWPCEADKKGGATLPWAHFQDIGTASMPQEIYKIYMYAPWTCNVHVDMWDRIIYLLLVLSQVEGCEGGSWLASC